MAVSKAFLFDEDEQLASIIGQAMGHPARVRMLKRLRTGQVLSYVSLTSSIPLRASTVKQHFNLLKRLKLVEPGLMADNKAGYRLNESHYSKCTAASRRESSRPTLVRELRKSEGEDFGWEMAGV